MTTEVLESQDSNHTDAAAQLLARHRDLQTAVETVLGQLHPGWLRDLTNTIRELDEIVDRHHQYQREHREPTSAQERAAWLAAGPKLTAEARRLNELPAAERASLRLLATLYRPDSLPRWRRPRTVSWCVGDVSDIPTDLLSDWVAIVLAENGRLAK